MRCHVRDIPVYYESYGSGRPILMLHGQPTDHRQMVSDLKPLYGDRPGWCRIYPDLPGMGQTTVADWIVCQDDVLDVVIALIDTLVPGERITVAGTSYGGIWPEGLCTVARRRWMACCSWRRW